MHEIVKITLGDKEFPKLLKQIHDPPKQLYCRGNIKLLNTFCFGIVGTRKITNYGKEATQFIVSGLAGTNMTIVSGLAMGVDAVAHQSALDNDLPTIAVLGSTVDDNGIGPKSNFNLAKDILKNNSLIISEYGNKKDIRKENFAIRDRIISGLCKGVLIVEGADKSGSLVTAKSAANQDRDVFAIPGSIFSQVSVGTNQLLKNGAKLVTSAADILEEYDQNPKLNFELKNDISTPGSESSDIMRYVAKPQSELLLPGTKEPTEKKILDILGEMGELITDEIIRASQIEASKILVALSMLEIKGRIKNLNNGKYRKL